VALSVRAAPRRPTATDRGFYEASNRASRELGEHAKRATEFGEALYTCLHERNSLLYFLIDLLRTSIDASAFGGSGANVAGNQARTLTRSSSVDRHFHKHSGCYAFNHQRPSSCGVKLHRDRRPESQNGGQDLLDLVKALEGEMSEVSHESSKQIQRIVTEAEKGARILGLLRGGGVADASLAANVAVDEVGNGPSGVHRTCLDWISEEQRRKEVQGLPQDSLAPCVDWNEERSQYRALTRAMETKFEQLAKLKKVLQQRQGGVTRGGRIRI